MYIKKHAQPCCFFQADRKGIVDDVQRRTKVLEFEELKKELLIK
jgi:hypothetical protein